MIKRLTFVRRADGVEPEAFADRWRQSALAPDRPLPDRLVHCVVRPGRTDRRYHGVAIEWFTDEPAGTAADTDSAVIDPGTTLRLRVDSRTVLGNDELERWWTSGGSRLVVLGMIQRAPALSREQFAAYWWDVHRPLANRLLPPEVQPDAYVHDYVLTDERVPFDGIGEFYDPSVEHTRTRTAWVERPDVPATAEIAADEARFLVRDTRWALLADATVVVPSPRSPQP